MNKNTRNARKGSPKWGYSEPLTNNPERTIGTGEKRVIGSRRADKPVKGFCCASYFGAGSNKNTSPKRYPRISMEKRAEEGW